MLYYRFKSIMRTNREFLKSLKAPASSFYLCDFHVHSPGSADTRIGDRFDELSPAEKQLLPKLADLPKDLAAYDKQAVIDCAVGKFYDLLVKRRDNIARAQGISEGSDWAFRVVTGPALQCDPADPFAYR